MKAFKLIGIRQMEMMDVPAPEIAGDDDVLIRMRAVGVCGSDVHYYGTGRIGSQVVDYPFTVGHEGAGEVIEVGAGVSVVKPGDSVAIDPAWVCGECDQCLAGRPHTCRNLRYLGCPKQMEGCLSELIVMPSSCCLLLPDSVSYEEAAISEPLSIGIYAVERSVPMRGAKVGILGVGPIGLSVLMPAGVQGAEVYVTDKIDGRIALARVAGAVWGGNPDNGDVVTDVLGRETGGLDVVFECCGEQDALDQAVDMLKPGGKLMLIGIPPSAERVTFKIDELRRKEICIQNVRRQNGCAQKAVEQIASRSFDVNIMITHRFTFGQTGEAFDLVAQYGDGVLKAMILFD